MTAKVESLEFIGKIWRNTGDYPGVWDEAHSSGFTKKLYDIQGHKQDFAIFINDLDQDLMIGIQKPNAEYNKENFEHFTVAESSWLIVYTKAESSNANIGALYGELAEQVEKPEYTVNSELPMIEKYPGGGSDDAIHLLMKPLK